MPPKVKFTREEIINSAMSVIKRDGESGLTARSLAGELGTSTKPIFGLFKSMEEVKEEVVKSAGKVYLGYVERAIASNEYPKYMSYGMGYIMFASEDPNLFRLLYMRDRSKDEPVGAKDRESLQSVIAIISKATGLNEDLAYRLHLEMWLLVHGIATTIVTSYAKWDMAFIRTLLTDQFLGIKTKLQGEQNGSNQDIKTN